MERGKGIFLLKEEDGQLKSYLGTYDPRLRTLDEEIEFLKNGQRPYSVDWPPGVLMLEAEAPNDWKLERGYSVAAEPFIPGARMISIGVFTYPKGSSYLLTDSETGEERYFPDLDSAYREFDRLVETSLHPKSLFYRLRDDWKPWLGSRKNFVFGYAHPSGRRVEIWEV